MELDLRIEGVRGGFILTTKCNGKEERSVAGNISALQEPVKPLLANAIGIIILEKLEYFKHNDAPVTLHIEAEKATALADIIRRDAAVARFTP